MKVIYLGVISLKVWCVGFNSKRLYSRFYVSVNYSVNNLALNFNSVLNFKAVLVGPALAIGSHGLEKCTHYANIYIYSIACLKLNGKLPLYLLPTVNSSSPLFLKAHTQL